jgi:hypothetical protein
MSNPKKTGLSVSKSSNKEFGNQSSEKEQKSSVSQPKSTVVEASSSALPPIHNTTMAFTFEAAMLHLQIAALTTVLAEASNQILKTLSEIEAINSQISLNGTILLVESQEIINLIQLVIDLKSKVTSIISWMAVIANIAHHFITNLEEQLNEELTENIEIFLQEFGAALDAALNTIPHEPILGITVAPDLRQISESKSVIANLLSTIGKIKEENEEAKQDWGAVEQKAYERISEGSNQKNVPAEEILSWLSALEQQK